MFLHQISLRSLEAIVRIGAKSVGRISEFGMHVGMQISGAAVCYTHPLTHRRFPPRPTDYLLCSDALGAMITELAPFFSHSKTLDNAESNSSNCSLAACSSFLSTENRHCPHLDATCGPASKPNCRGCGPKTPRHCAPPAVTAWSHSFWRLLQMLRCILGTCRLPYTV